MEKLIDVVKDYFDFFSSLIDEFDEMLESLNMKVQSIKLGKFDSEMLKILVED